MKKPSAAAMSYAQEQLMLAVVRALMESHPNPDSFRESFAHCWAILHREHVKNFAGTALFEESEEAIRQLMPVWQSFFPDSEQARTKPRPPGRD